MSKSVKTTLMRTVVLATAFFTATFVPLREAKGFQYNCCGTSDCRYLSVYSPCADNSACANNSSWPVCCVFACLS
jgi:hypothetical protein